jgi:hypothetical protein
MSSVYFLFTMMKIQHLLQIILLNYMQYNYSQSGRTVITTIYLLLDKNILN